jgi:hypothetical protein
MLGLLPRSKLLYELVQYGCVLANMANNQLFFGKLKVNENQLPEGPMARELPVAWSNLLARHRQGESILKEMYR